MTTNQAYDHEFENLSLPELREIRKEMIEEICEYWINIEKNASMNKIYRDKLYSINRIIIKKTKENPTNF